MPWAVPRPAIWAADVATWPAGTTDQAAPDVLPLAASAFRLGMGGVPLAFEPCRNLPSLEHVPSLYCGRDNKTAE